MMVRGKAPLREILEGLMTTLGHEVIFLVDGEFAGAVGALELCENGDVVKG